MSGLMDGGCEVLLVNPPYLTITSRYGVGHQVPLGLLMVGGALLAAGVKVRLLDAEALRLSVEEVARRVEASGARVVMTGHAGSTPAHGVCVEMLGAIKRRVKGVVTVYGGVYPTYHAREILGAEKLVDVIVCGEGEATGVELVRAILEDGDLREVRAIGFRSGGEVVVTGEREPIGMNDFRIGWELLEDWDLYQCFGLGRAVIVQLSRGCPHHCTYCGQHGFWMKWQNRDPVKLADEIEWLCRERGVRFVTLADENPTTIQGVWRTFLEEVARRKLPVKMFATIRATDIVRDREMMGLYRDAGILYVLMGIETTDAATLERVRKGSTTREDHAACKLLTGHGIHAIVGHIVGFGEERWGDFWRAFRQLSVYDGDFLNAMFVMPHAWTPFAEESGERVVVERKRVNWDYRHQILGQRYMRPWELFAAVKLLELVFHLRPRRLARLLGRGAFSRRLFWWGLGHTGMVWLAEIGAFVRDWRTRDGKGTLREWYGKAGVGARRQEERVVGLRVLRRGREVVEV